MSKSLGKIYKVMIGNLVAPPQDGEKTKFWPREMKLAKDLYARIPNESFWTSLKLSFKLKSLAGGKLPHVWQEIEDRYKQFNYQPPKTEQKIEISVEKFGEDFDNKTKPKLLKDLLR